MKLQSRGFSCLSILITSSLVYARLVKRRQNLASIKQHDIIQVLTMWRSGYQQPHPEYHVDAVMVSIVEKNLTPPLRDGPAHEALIRVENHFLDIIRVLDDRNKALEKERVSINRLEDQVTELEGDAVTNLVVLRELKEKVAKLEENKEPKKNGLDDETEEPESEEEGEWEEGCDFLIIMTHQVPERRRLKDVEAEKWTGMFRDEFLAGL